MSNVDRISLEELHRIANKVRAAGGGNPIDALMPAVPEEPTMCLIAKNLNFNCVVSGFDDFEIRDFLKMDSGGPTVWYMGVPTRELGRKISRALGWKLIDTEKLVRPYRWGAKADGVSRWKLVLPPEIGRLAADFDRAGTILTSVEYWVSVRPCDDGFVEKTFKQELRKGLLGLSGEARCLLREMQPYIQVAEEEAYSLARMIHPDGSISI